MDTTENRRVHTDHLFKPGAKVRRALEFKRVSPQSVATATKDWVFRESTKINRNGEFNLPILVDKLEGGKAKFADISNVFRQEMRSCWLQIREIEKKLKETNGNSIQFGKKDVLLQDVERLISELEMDNFRARLALASWDKVRLVGFLPGTNADSDISFVAKQLGTLFSKYDVKYSTINLTKVR